MVEVRDRPLRPFRDKCASPVRLKLVAILSYAIDRELICTCLLAEHTFRTEIKSPNYCSGLVPSNSSFFL